MKWRKNETFASLKLLPWKALLPTKFSRKKIPSQPYQYLIIIVSPFDYLGSHCSSKHCVCKITTTFVRNLSYNMFWDICWSFMTGGEWRPQEEEEDSLKFFFDTTKTRISFAYCLVYLSVRRSLSRTESLHFFLSLCSMTMSLYCFPVWNIREAKIQWQITIANKKSRKKRELFFHQESLYEISMLALRGKSFLVFSSILVSSFSQTLRLLWS